MYMAYHSRQRARSKTIPTHCPYCGNVAKMFFIIRTNTGLVSSLRRWANRGRNTAAANT